MNKKTIALKILGNKKARGMLVRALKNQHVRRVIVGQLKRRAFGK